MRGEPDEAAEALEELRRTKKKCRVLRLPCHAVDYPGRQREVRSVLGGLLVQDSDLTDLDPAALKVVSKRPPSVAFERYELPSRCRATSRRSLNASIALGD